MVRIRLKDKVLEFKEGVILKEVLDENLKRGIVGVKSSDNIFDVHTPLSSGEYEAITLKSPEFNYILRHSAAHIMAQAIQHLYPGVKFAIGPAIEKGFYYDMELDAKITPDDFPKIEQEMQRICAENHEFIRKELSFDEAIEYFKKRDDKFKVELIEEINDRNEKISIYQQGDFVDLCRGPHLPSTDFLKNFKLLSVAGAYWRGDEKREMLQRVYGTAFADKKELKQYLKFLEEAKERDHRRIGTEMRLFSLHNEIGPGLVLFHPNGANIRLTVEDFLKKEHHKRGYKFVITPHIMKADIWKISGHYENYREHMFFLEVEEQEYGVKPMNCPPHILIYKSDIRSYRHMPIKYFEFGTVYRYEKSGVLHGLLRVRGFTIDDAHIFCAPYQLQDIIEEVLEFILYLMKTFGLDFKVNVGTRPEKFIGSEENWDKATKALMDALERHGMEYEIAEGDGAFYGPKIDMAFVDSLGRIWDGPTIQLDFALPERFDLYYTEKDGTRQRPVLVHRAVLGSLERFIGMLTEHYKGTFPTWLSPIQCAIINVNEEQREYARKLHNELLEKGIRSELDIHEGSLSGRIKNVTRMHVPYILIVGPKEQDAGLVAVRKRGKGDIGQMKFEEFLEMLQKEIDEKK